MSKMKDVRTIAEEEVRLENFRAAVEREKARIRAHRPWWHWLWPWVITISKRKYQ